MARPQKSPGTTPENTNQNESPGTTPENDGLFVMVKSGHEDIKVHASQVAGWEKHGYEVAE